MAPEYQGIASMLVPADGRRLLLHDWPKFRSSHGCTFYPDGTFTIPNKEPQVAKDIARMATIIRYPFVDLRTGNLHMRCEEIDDYTFERMQRGKSPEQLHKELTSWPKI